jgi:hypothetical protein
VNTHAAPGAPFGAADVGVLYARVLDTATTLGLGLTPWPAGMPEYWFHLHGRSFTAGEWPTLDVNPLAGSLRSLPPPALAFQFLPRPNPLPDLGAWLKDEHQGLELLAGPVPAGERRARRGPALHRDRHPVRLLDDISALWRCGRKICEPGLRGGPGRQFAARYFINGGTSGSPTPWRLR